MAVTFSQLDLHASIHKAVDICGYTTPTPVQAQSIPEILNGNDVAVSAQTGSGKTAAFVLPALHQLTTQQRNKKTRILILTPTRELANQISKAASLYGKFLQFNIVNLVGGMPYHHQIRDLARGADIIVATPGRLLDHIEQKRVDLSNIQMLVLDEADRMLDMGFIDDVNAIADLTSDERQTLLFSATLDNKLMSITRHLLKKPVRIDLSSEKIAAPQIRQELYKTNNPQHKARLLKHFLNDANIYKAIIFSATKINADKLANQLRDEGFAAAALHGDLRQNVRNRTIDQLRRGKIQILVATDVAARGIDISDITHVINYDLPRFCEDYVHRIGRTGRAGKSGIAISFVLPTDMRHVQRIERYIGQRLKLTTLAADGSESVTPIKAANEAKNDREVSKYHRDYSEKSFSRKNKKTSSARDWDERTRSRDDRVRDRSDSTRSRDERVRDRYDSTRSRDERVRYRSDSTRSRDDRVRDRSDSTRSRDDRVRDRSDSTRSRDERVRYRSDSTRSRDDRVRDRSDSTRSREDRVRDRDDRRFKNDRREDSHSKSDKNEKPFRKKKFFSNQKKSLKSSKNRDFKEANSA